MQKKLFIASLIVIILALASVLFLLNGKTPIRYWFSSPTSFAECQAAGGVMLETYPEQCSFRGHTFPNPNQQAQTPPAQNPQTSVRPGTYTDVGNGFSLEYPPEIFTRSTEAIQLPFFNSIQTAQSLVLTHTVPVEHCGLSGLPEHCTPTTTDIKVTITVVNLTLSQISQSKMGPLENTFAGSNQFKTTSQGVEGEGINYYFISLTNGKTLMITQSYINEVVVGGYQTVKDFIPYAQQNTITATILKSLNIK